MLACLQSRVDAQKLLCDKSILTSRLHKFATLQLVYAFWSAQCLKNDHMLRTACTWALRLSLAAQVAE